MNGPRPASPDPSRRQVRVSGSRPAERLAGLLATSLAVLVLAIGFRLTLDAAPLASRFSAGGTDVGPGVIRSAGIALLAAGQWIALGGVVGRIYRRRRMDKLLG